MTDSIWAESMAFRDQDAVRAAKYFEAKRGRQADHLKKLLANCKPTSSGISFTGRYAYQIAPGIALSENLREHFAGVRWLAAEVGFKVGALVFSAADGRSGTSNYSFTFGPFEVNELPQLVTELSTPSPTPEARRIEAAHYWAKVPLEGARVDPE